MENANVTLLPLTDADREQFILENQRAFKYGAVEEFGMRDDHFEEDGEIISRKTIEQRLDAQDSLLISRQDSTACSAARFAMAMSRSDAGSSRSEKVLPAMFFPVNVLYQTSPVRYLPRP